jgi:PPM family protein phosphatase
VTEDNSAKVPRWFAASSFPGPLDAPPPSVIVDVEFGARSRPSPVRSVANEHYLVVRTIRHQDTLMSSIPDRDLPELIDECTYGMVIADGMGVAGEVASRFAISTLMHLAIYFGKWHLRIDEPIAEEMIDRVERFYRNIDATLQEVSQDATHRLQTTMTAVYTVGTDLFLAHVGDSRAYVFRDDQLMRLTRDHTIDREGPGKAKGMGLVVGPADRRRIMAETLGGEGMQRLDIERCGLADGDLVLVCSNGLTNVVEEARIANALRLRRTPDGQCRALVDLAVRSGANDDVTALVAHYRIRTRE